MNNLLQGVAKRRKKVYTVVWGDGNVKTIWSRRCPMGTNPAVSWKYSKENRKTPSGQQEALQWRSVDITDRCSMRDLPEYYGPWQTVYKRFAQWGEDGKLKAMFEHLRQNPNMQDLCIDGTYIKAHRASTGAKKGIKIAIVNNALALVVEDDPPKSTQS